MDVEEKQPVIVSQDAAVPKSDTKIVFGTSALTMNTPDSIKAIFKFLTFLTTIAGLVVANVPEIPVGYGKIILEASGLVILILQKAEDFFGIQVS